MGILMILGLTGGYCTGKNELAKILESEGFKQIDVDLLGRIALDSRIDEVVKLLGSQTILSNGKPDRKAIAKLVFRNSRLLTEYEKIVHPPMVKLLDDRIDELIDKGNSICINAAVLYKIPAVYRCDKIIEIRASFINRVKRGLERDNASFFPLVCRILSQSDMFRKKKQLGLKNIYTLTNNGSLSKLTESLYSVLPGIKNM